MIGGDGSWKDLNWNLIGVLAAMLGGGILLWIALKLAFSVTGRLVTSTPPLY